LGYVGFIDRGKLVFKTVITSSNIFIELHCRAAFDQNAALLFSFNGSISTNTFISYQRAAYLLLKFYSGTSYIIKFKHF